jgi:hypothetical protein
MEVIQDVTNKANRSGCLKAERKGRQALVLTKCDKPVKCADGKRRSYQVEEALLSCDGDDELACVRCNEFNYYTRKDILPVLTGRKTLFETVPFN